MELAARDTPADPSTTDAASLELAAMQAPVLAAGQARQFSLTRLPRVLKYAKHTRERSFASICVLPDRYCAKLARGGRFA
jgi:hypothetical protein